MKIYNDLHETSSIDAQQALTRTPGGPSNVPGSGGGTVIQNIIGGEGSTVQALSVGGNTKQAVDLKDTAAFNANLKRWGNIPTKPANVTPGS
jgi:hypothetical protein